MLSHELDDVMYHLGEVYAVFGKAIGVHSARVWREIFATHERTDCLRALDELVRTEKYAPKPCDVKKRLGEYRLNRGENPKRVYRGDDPLTRRALIADAQHQHQEADPRIASAWVHYHCAVFGAPPPIPGAGKGNFVPLGRDEWIEIINTEARRLDMIEAIEPGFRIPESAT